MELNYLLQLQNFTFFQSSGPVMHRFIIERPGLATAFMTILGLGSCFGTIGNVLAILAVSRSKELSTVGNMFIVNLACADLCVSGFVGPMNIVGIIFGEEFFGQRKILCVFIACICLTSCICSLLNIAAVAVNRYINIIYMSLYKRIFTVRNTIFFCAMLWVISFLLEMPNFIGWGGHGYDKKTLSCVWDRTADFSYTLFFSAGIVGTCLVATFFCYLKIFLHYNRITRRIRIHKVVFRKDINRGLRASFKLARTLCIIFVSFVVCWVPYSFIVTFDVADNWPIETHGWAIVVAHTNSCINSIIYGLTNPQFRQAYGELMKHLCLNVFKCSWCRRNSVITKRLIMIFTEPSFTQYTHQRAETNLSRAPRMQYSTIHSHMRGDIELVQLTQQQNSRQLSVSHNNFPSSSV